VRHLPEIGWFVLVFLFPLVGGIGWVLVVRDRGRPRRTA
jgi:hypothetical protein